MLTITVPGCEFFDERTGEFIQTKPTTIVLEHSLRSLIEWESKWHKAFLGSTDKTLEECIDYVRCMTINRDVDPLVYKCLNRDLFEKINAYIEEPMTATTIREMPGRRNSRGVVTGEEIYYMMTALDIPFSCEEWHLNRLLMLIRVCNIRNTPQKKMSKKDIYNQNRALNAERKKRLGTHG